MSTQNSKPSGPANVLAAVPPTGLLMFLGYLLLFLGSVCFDQATKFHSEQAFLTWSDPHDIRAYRGSRERVGTLGNSPSSVREAIRDTTGKTTLEGGPALEQSEAPGNNAPSGSAKISASWLDFNLTYVRNPGAAWGSFSNAPAQTRLWFFYGVTFCVSALILYLFYSSHPGQRLTRIALVLILSGAMGNFLDRLQLEYVIDFLHLHWRVFGWEYSFPVFNWADVCINLGIVFMVVDLVLQEKALKKAIEISKGSAENSNFIADSRLF